MRIIHFSCILALGALLAGCNFKGTPDPVLSKRDTEWMALAPQAEEDRIYGRYLTADPTGEAPGTVVVDTKERQPYLVLPDRKAMRYGVTVGDEAFGWTGTARIARKAEWPAWNPPAEMKQRSPLRRPVGRGPAIPLGARALDLCAGDRDPLYRIHGINEPDKIGRAASSGYPRMRNIDV